MLMGPIDSMPVKLTAWSAPTWKPPSSLSGPGKNVTGLPPGMMFSVSPGKTPIGSLPFTLMAVVADGVTLNVSTPLQAVGGDGRHAGVVDRLQADNGNLSAVDVDGVGIRGGIDRQLIRCAGPVDGEVAGDVGEVEDRSAAVGVLERAAVGAGGSHGQGRGGRGARDRERVGIAGATAADIDGAHALNADRGAQTGDLLHVAQRSQRGRLQVDGDGVVDAGGAVDIQRIVAGRAGGVDQHVLVVCRQSAGDVERIDAAQSVQNERGDARCADRQLRVQRDRASGGRNGERVVAGRAVDGQSVGGAGIGESQAAGRAQVAVADRQQAADLNAARIAGGAGRIRVAIGTGWQWSRRQRVAAALAVDD